MSALGFYFTTKGVSIVEVAGKKVLTNIRIPDFSYLIGDKESKISDDTKITELIRQELEKNGVKTREAFLCLSGRDIIIRTFDMPILPPSELYAAVNFEAKKYTPFKLEELITDFQVKFDRENNRNVILFAGIKKDTLERYSRILNQLRIKIITVEYAAFSLLRMIKMAAVPVDQVTAVINMDIKEGDEENFVVLDGGVPLFSRDINLGTEFALSGSLDNERLEDSIEKFKTEIRVSFDYYHRKFPGKAIKSVILIGGPDYASDLKTFLEELGLSVRILDLGRIFKAMPIAFSLTFLKAYSVGLFKTLPNNVKINLLQGRKAEGKKLSLAEYFPPLANVKLNPLIFLFGILLCLGGYFLGEYQVKPFREKISAIEKAKNEIVLKIPNVPEDVKEVQVNDLIAENRGKISSVENLLKNQVYLTGILDVLPRLIEPGIRLNSIYYGNERENSRRQLDLKGTAYLANNEQELSVVNTFVSKIKESPVIKKYFNEVELVSISRVPKGQNSSETVFEIICRNYK